jgi:hypothetical protein
MPSSALVQKAFVIDTRNVQKALSIYRAVNQTLRLQIIEMIHKEGALHLTPILQQVNRFVQVWGGVPGASGFTKITSYYDTATQQYLGDVSE